MLPTRSDSVSIRSSSIWIMFLGIDVRDGGAHLCRRLGQGPRKRRQPAPQGVHFVDQRQHDRHGLGARSRDRGAAPGSAAAARRRPGRKRGSAVVGLRPHPAPPRSRPGSRSAAPSAARPGPRRATSCAVPPASASARGSYGCAASQSADCLLQRRIGRARQGDLQPDILVAGTSPPASGRPLPFSRSTRAGGRAAGNGHGDRAVQRRHGHLGAADRLAQA